MHKYETVIYWSKEDDAYIAEVPELPGCMAHGANDKEVLDNIHQAMTLWLASAREGGVAVPKSRGRRLTNGITCKLHWQ